MAQQFGNINSPMNFFPSSNSIMLTNPLATATPNNNQHLPCPTFGTQVSSSAKQFQFSSSNNLNCNDETGKSISHIILNYNKSDLAKHELDIQTVLLILESDEESQMLPDISQNAPQVIKQDSELQAKTTKVKFFYLLEKYF